MVKFKKLLKSEKERKKFLKNLNKNIKVVRKEIGKFGVAASRVGEGFSRTGENLTNSLSMNQRYNGEQNMSNSQMRKLPINELQFQEFKRKMNQQNTYKPQRRLNLGFGGY